MVQRTDKAVGRSAREPLDRKRVRAPNAPGPVDVSSDQGQPPLGVNASMTLSRLKLAAFCRGG